MYKCCSIMCEVVRSQIVKPIPNSPSLDSLLQNATHSILHTHGLTDNNLNNDPSEHVHERMCRVTFLKG